MEKQINIMKNVINMVEKKEDDMVKHLENERKEIETIRKNTMNGLMEAHKLTTESFEEEMIKHQQVFDTTYA